MSSEGKRKRRREDDDQNKEDPCVKRQRLENQRGKLTDELDSLIKAQNNLESSIASLKSNLKDVIADERAVILSLEVDAIIDKCKKNRRLVVLLQPSIIQNLDKTSKEKLIAAFPKFQCSSCFYTVWEDKIDSNTGTSWDDDGKGDECENGSALVRSEEGELFKVHGMALNFDIHQRDKSMWKDAGFSVDETHLQKLDPMQELNFKCKMAQQRSDVAFGIEFGIEAGLIALCDNYDTLGIDKDHLWEWEFFEKMLGPNPC